jgi:hypothetical protein
LSNYRFDLKAINKYKVVCSLIFIFAFIAKMMLTTLPIIFDGKKILIKTISIQIEQDSKEESKDGKDLDNQVKKGTEFIKNFEFSAFNNVTTKKISLSFYSKKYLIVFHPKVLTPPPNNLQFLA